ncbi:hypothetical protein FPQ18DRAFT_129208 [Pyronema domesticum]|nr:hypothetical protein FPQ18DRAFT_129208 [Pyronema domesticum]
MKCAASEFLMLAGCWVLLLVLLLLLLLLCSALLCSSCSAAAAAAAASRRFSELVPRLSALLYSLCSALLCSALLFLCCFWRAVLLCSCFPSLRTSPNLLETLVNPLSSPTREAVATPTPALQPTALLEPVRLVSGVCRLLCCCCSALLQLVSTSRSTYCPLHPTTPARSTTIPFPPRRRYLPPRIRRAEIVPFTQTNTHSGNSISLVKIQPPPDPLLCRPSPYHEGATGESNWGTFLPTPHLHSPRTTRRPLPVEGASPHTISPLVGVRRT